MGLVERGKKKEKLELLVPELLCLCTSVRSFLTTTCKIFQILPDVSSLSAQHHGPCNCPFYHVVLLPYLHTISLLTSTRLCDRPGLLQQNGCVLFSSDSYLFLWPCLSIWARVSPHSGFQGVFLLQEPICSMKTDSVYLILDTHCLVKWIVQPSTLSGALSRGPYTAPERHRILQGIVHGLHLPVRCYSYLTSASGLQISHMFRGDSSRDPYVWAAELRSRYWLMLQQCCRMPVSSSATALPSPAMGTVETIPIPVALATHSRTVSDADLSQWSWSCPQLVTWCPNMSLAPWRSLMPGTVA